MLIPSRDTLRTLVSVLPLLLLAGCCGEFFRGSDDVVSITISPLNSSIQPGITQKFSAIGTFGTGGTGDVTTHVKWASSDPARASIDSNGQATGIAYSTVTISGTYQCCTSKTSLSVSNQAAAISSIAVTQQNRTITAGHTQQFVAIARYSNETHSVITNAAQWTSSDNAIATVGAAGVATGVTSGNATISATSGTVSGSTTVRVQ